MSVWFFRARRKVEEVRARERYELYVQQKALEEAERRKADEAAAVKAQQEEERKKKAAEELKKRQVRKRGYCCAQCYKGISWSRLRVTFLGHIQCSKLAVPICVSVLLRLDKHASNTVILMCLLLACPCRTAGGRKGGCCGVAGSAEAGAGGGSCS